MKIKFLFLSIVFFYSCRNKEIGVSQFFNDRCHIKYYESDSTQSRIRTEIFYNSDAKILRFKRTTLGGYFPDDTTISVSDVVYENGSPVTLTNSRNNSTSKFAYRKNNELASVTFYEGIFPIRKLSIGWKNGKITRIDVIFFEVIGSPSEPENYVEKPSSYSELDFNSDGNLSILRNFTANGKLYSTVGYTYDSNDNLLRNLYFLSGSFESSNAYLLSKNNVTKISYFFDNASLNVEQNLSYIYNSDGLPQNAFWNGKISKIEYNCQK